MSERAVDVIASRPRPDEDDDDDGGSSGDDDDDGNDEDGGGRICAHTNGRF